MSGNMREALKPCPFCDGEAVRCFNVERPSHPMYWVLCRDCHASPGDRRTEEEADAIWNNRAPPPLDPEARKLCERLLKTLQVYNGLGTFREERVNPDGPAAASLITAQSARLVEAERKLAMLEAARQSVSTPDPSQGSG